MSDSGVSDQPDSPLAQEDDLPAEPASPVPENRPAADDDAAEKDSDDSDDESVLSEVDEAQFENFDAANLAIDDRPELEADEENLKLIGRHKRKRTAGEEEPARKKKKKEGKREKVKKPRKKRGESDDHFSGGEELDGKRARKSKKDGEKGARAKRAATPEDEQALDPEERRRRALDRAMDAALRNPNKRRARKVDGIDLADMADAEIEDVRKRMTEAAERDAVARRAGKPAMYKLKMLPEVVSLLNRNTFVQSLVDPEINLLEAVRFFLEPLEDGALPAYNIQRDLFAALAKLPITKDTLFASGIGKVILFYTKSKRPEPGIKRQAEKLLADWTRPILQRTDDYSKKVFQTAEYDPNKIPIRPATSRIREGQKPDDGKSSTRARVDINTKSYSIVPLATSVKDGVYARPIGASGEDRFRKMKARQLAAAGKGRKR